MGEHHDYNDSLVLPTLIPQSHDGGVRAARTNRRVRAWSERAQARATPSEQYNLGAESAAAVVESSFVRA